MENVSEDFSRLHGTAAGAAEGFNPTKTHPVFGAIHSMVLGHKYGNDPYMYMNNPGLRAMDTREAAFQGLQKVGAGIQRYSQRFKRAQPSPAVTSPAAPTAPTPKPGPPPSNWIG
jgi:hypothetical protein